MWDCSGHLPLKPALVMGGTMGCHEPLQALLFNQVGFLLFLLLPHLVSLYVCPPENICGSLSTWLCLCLVSHRTPPPSPTCSTSQRPCKDFCLVNARRWVQATAVLEGARGSVCGRSGNLPFLCPGTHPSQTTPSFPGSLPAAPELNGETGRRGEKGESAAQVLSLPLLPPRACIPQFPNSLSQGGRLQDICLFM